MNAKQIINYIPTELLQELCLKFEVDHQVKKLDGVSMFQLLLYSFLTTREASYRVIEEVYHSISFARVAYSKPFAGARLLTRDGTILIDV